MISADDGRKSRHRTLVHTFKISMRHKCATHATLHDQSVHKRRFHEASIVGLIAAHRSPIPSAFLVLDGLWALLVGHIKWNNEQVSGAARRTLFLARCVCDQRWARNASIGMSR